MPGDLPWRIYGTQDNSLLRCRTTRDGSIYFITVDPGEKNLCINLRLRLPSGVTKHIWGDVFSFEGIYPIREYVFQLASRIRASYPLGMAIVEMQPDLKTFNARVSECFLCHFASLGVLGIEINNRRKSIELKMPKDLTGTLMKEWIVQKALELEWRWQNIDSANYIATKIAERGRGSSKKEGVSGERGRAHDYSVTICQAEATFIAIQRLFLEGKIIWQPYYEPHPCIN